MGLVTTAIIIVFIFIRYNVCTVLDNIHDKKRIADDVYSERTGLVTCFYTVVDNRWRL